MKLFECGVRYNKMLENGMQKKVTELYIVDALSFSEAEQRIIKEMEPYGEFDVVSEKITNYSELVRSGDAMADLWYKVKINLVCIDEKTMREKKTPCWLLVQAKDIDDARRLTNEHMKDSVVDWNCESVSETKIMDVFVYGEESDKKIARVDAASVVRQSMHEFRDDDSGPHPLNVVAPERHHTVYIDKKVQHGKARDDI